MLHDLPQTLRRGWAALPLWPRCLLLGTALLGAILLGGAVTAYGGLLLVGLMWALCTGGLWLLLTTVWRLCFPREPLREQKAFLVSFAVGSLAGVAVIAALVFYRRTFYETDAVNYYAKQLLLFGSFGSNGFYGVRTLLDNLIAADYKMFINLFISIPYFFLGRSIEMFMVSYALTCFVPMWFALLMGAKWLAGHFAGCRAAWYYPLCMALMVLWPMFLWPATHGMADAFGLTFAAAALLLTADYRFDTLEPGRLFALWASVLALLLTRRWYMFWAAAYAVLYLAALLISAARRHCLPRTVKNLFCFAVPAALGILLPLAPTFYTALTTDYADIYGAYYGGGFLANCQVQLGKQGLLFLALCAAGLLAALGRRRLRGPALVLAGASLLAMALFTRVQSLGDHQSLILAPAYLGLGFCALAALCAARAKAVQRAGGLLAAVCIGLNFFNALRLPGASVGTPLLSNEGLDLTRRTDFDAVRALTDYMLAHCAPGETVYPNISSDGYSGTVFAYSDTARPELQTMFLWESCIPSTHGFPTGIWTSRYVLVSDRIDDSLVGRINGALRCDTPAAAHYAYVTEFPLAGVTLYCYERLAAPDAAEAEYFKTLFADYDARWPALYSERIDAFMAGEGPDFP